MRMLLWMLLVLALASPALAVDGVGEINQTCATQTGCFSGDSAGFPVTITTSGSYRLTSRLVLPNENTDGILVSTSAVSIDLNGFEIAGPVTCSGGPIVCTPASGTGSAIDRSISTIRGISVKNGVVTGVGSIGIRVGEQSEVTGVRVRWCAATGITTGNNAIIRGNTVYQNGGDGIFTGIGATVVENSVYQNLLDGIETNAGAMISNNSASFNAATGIDAGSASTVTGNTSYNSGINGIEAEGSCTVVGNTVYSNTLNGIEAQFGGNLVARNNAQDNVGFGMVLALQDAYRENLVGGNTGGTVQENGAVDMGSNSCNATTTCP